MAIKKISEFPTSTPASTDKILFEQNERGRCATIEDVGKAIGINIDLLWTNVVPSSPFDSQNINLDLSGYSYVRLLVIADCTSAKRTISVWDLSKGFNYRVTANYSSFNRRKIDVSDTGIVFFDCEVISSYGGSDINIYNHSCVPYQIWGVK